MAKSIRSRVKARVQKATPGAEGARGDEPPSAPSVQRKLKKRVQFLERVRASALAVRGASGVGKRKRPVKKGKTLKDFSALSEALAHVPTRTASTAFLAASAKAVTVNKRMRTCATEAARFAAVLDNATFTADPIAAVTNHILAALPPPPLLSAVETQRRPKKKKHAAR